MSRANRKPPEVFTVNRLVLSPSLARSLVSTNMIEGLYSGVPLRTRRVCRWRDDEMGCFAKTRSVVENILADSPWDSIIAEHNTPLLPWYLHTVAEARPVLPSRCGQN